MPSEKRNYIGKITRHSAKAGVTLRARITSPSGNLTVYKDFKCMVKALGLTDEQAVIADLNYVSNRLINYGVAGIKNNITTYMPVAGPNETNISYKVSGATIEKYFNSDGVVTDRPAYGEAAAVGTLIITVKRNAAVAEREITISVDPYTIDEVKDSITSSITWNSIRGKNWAEASDDATSGLSNVMFPLNLTKTVKSPYIKNPIDVEWEITDALEEIMDGNPRINVSTGEIYRPDYVNMFKAKQEKYTLRNLLSPCNTRIDGGVNKTMMRLDGLILTGKFVINDTVNSITINESVSFNLKTLSNAIRNDDIREWMTDNISHYLIKDTRYAKSFSSLTMNDGESSAREVFMDKSSSPTTASILSLYSKQNIIDDTKDNEFTGEADGIRLTRLEWFVVDPSSMGTGGTVTTISDLGPYSRTGMVDTGTNKQIILNPSASATPADKLVLMVTMSFAEYDGAASHITVYYWFKITDATPVVAPVTPPITPSTP